MKTSRTTTALLACLAVSAMLLAGCDPPTETPVDDTITNADAAALIAMSYARSGGFLLNLGHAVDVSRGGSIADAQRRKDHGGAIILHDTTVTSNRTVTIDGKPYSYALNIQYGYKYMTNGFTTSFDNFFDGNTELKFTGIMKGTVTKPGLAATDSAWCELFINNTADNHYTMSGKFSRIGTYTFTGTTKVFTGSITTANIPGADVDKALKLIDDSQAGNIEINVRGKDQKGKDIRFEGVIIARPGAATRVNVNGTVYTMNLESGTAMKQ